MALAQRLGLGEPQATTSHPFPESRRRHVVEKKPSSVDQHDDANHPAPCNSDGDLAVPYDFRILLEHGCRLLPDPLM